MNLQFQTNVLSINKKNKKSIETLTQPNLPEVLKEPIAKAHFIGREISRSPGRIDVDPLRFITEPWDRGHRSRSTGTDALARLRG